MTIQRVPPLVAAILPACRPHLIAGPSGVGKTTWAFPDYLDVIERGLPLFGYPTITPMEWCYVSCDRPLEETCDTLERIDFPIDESRLFEKEQLVTQRGGMEDIVQIIKNATTPHVFVEGLQSLVTDMCSYREVSTFLRLLTKAEKSFSRTLSGTVHSPKTKEGEGYLNPRERVGGSVAWGAYSSTIMLLERSQPDQPESAERLLYLLPRQARDQLFHYVLDKTGRYCPVDMLDSRAAANGCGLLQDIQTAPAGKVFRTTEIFELARKRGLSEDQTERWLKVAVQIGDLVRPVKGQYISPKAN